MATNLGPSLALIISLGNFQLCANVIHVLFINILQVTNVISKGITKFALDMDDAIYKNSNYSNGNRKKENIVFSPLSLAGTMAIVLLASGGNTFEEVAKILGLESGVDVSRHSEVVHEMFGLLIGMVDTKKNGFGPQATYANGIFIQVYKSTSLHEITLFKFIWTVIYS